MAPRQKLIAIHPVHGYAIQPQQDLKTMKRNARERNRVQAVNSCFENLRRCVPSAAVYKKMSKVNIVQHALEYIHQLMEILQDDDQLSPGSEQSSLLSTSSASLFHYPSSSLFHCPTTSSTSSSTSLPFSHPHEWTLRHQHQASYFPSTPFGTPSTPFSTPSTPFSTPNTPFLTPITPFSTPSTPFLTPSTPFLTPTTPTHPGDSSTHMVPYHQATTTVFPTSPHQVSAYSYPPLSAQFSPVSPTSPDEEEDVLDAIVEWQTC